MSKLGVLVSLLVVSTAQAQSPQTIEGFWQDVAGRTTFKRNVPPAATYGEWNARELDATYPQAKEIHKGADGFDLADLNYDENEYAVRVLYAEPSRIVFVRKAGWSPCRMEHDCRLAKGELLCAMQSVCLEAGKEVVDWKGDER